MSTDPDLQVQVFTSPSGLKLLCHSFCLQDHASFLWYENDGIVGGETSASYRGHVWPESSYSCGYQGFRSPPVCEFTSDTTAQVQLENQPPTSWDALLSQMLRRFPR